MAAPALNLEQIVTSENGLIDPTMEAAYSSVLELNTGLIGSEVSIRLYRR